MNFEKEFIEKLVKQDQRAFNEFYLKTVDVFFRYLNSYYFLDQETSEDIISEFYVKWRDTVKKYDEKQSFSAFVWTVFKNLVKDSLKKQKDLAFSDFEKEDDGSNFEENIPDDETDFFDLLEKDFQYKQIQDAMKELDSDSREIIYLKFIEEKDNNEIADVLWLSVENIRQKLSRALKKLKVLLETDII